MPEDLITLSKHACFGGAVSFNEHRSETCDEKIQENARPLQHWRERYPNLNIQAIEYGPACSWTPTSRAGRLGGLCGIAGTMSGLSTPKSISKVL